MKAKKLTKKLNLNKETVADLAGGDMKKVQGGIGLTINWTNCLACSGTCGYSCLGTCVSCNTNDTVDPQGACCCLPEGR